MRGDEFLVLDGTTPRRLMHRCGRAADALVARYIGDEEVVMFTTIRHHGPAASRQCVTLVTPHELDQ